MVLVIMLTIGVGWLCVVATLAWIDVCFRVFTRTVLAYVSVFRFGGGSISVPSLHC